jgi:hypothetical protein
MSNGNSSPSPTKYNLVAFGVIIAVALIVCTFIGRATLIKVKSFGNTISVTGAANKPIESDLAIWEAEISTSAATVETGYAKIRSDIVKVTEFMRKQGLAPDEYNLSGVNVMKNYNREGVVTGLTLNQRIKIEMNDVERVTKLYRESSALLEQGVQINSYDPRYLFTGLDNLKLEMIKVATENAQLRAQQLVETTGRKVGAPISARLGVFQIRPLHSQEVSNYGMSDVSSISKEIVCTVNISFLIE